MMATIDKRVYPSGSVKYRVRTRLKGFPVVSASFARLTDAKRWAATTESAQREGRHFTPSEAKRHTLTELLVRYEVKFYLSSRRTRATSVNNYAGGANSSATAYSRL